MRWRGFVGKGQRLAFVLGLVKLAVFVRSLVRRRASRGGVSSCMRVAQGKEMRLSPEQRSASRLRKKRRQCTMSPQPDGGGGLHSSMA